LTQTVQPARLLSFGQAYCGVGGMTLRTNVEATSNSAISILELTAAPTED
jgi:hypothetical protein